MDHDLPSGTTFDPVLKLTDDEKNRYATIIVDRSPSLNDERVKIFRRIVTFSNAEAKTKHQNDLLNEVVNVCKRNGKTSYVHSTLRV